MLKKEIESDRDQADATVDESISAASFIYMGKSAFSKKPRNLVSVAPVNPLVDRFTLRHCFISTHEEHKGYVT